MPDLRLHRFFCQFRKAVPAVHRRTGFPCKRQHALCTAQPGFQRGAIWQEEEQNRVPIIPGEKQPVLLSEQADGTACMPGHVCYRDRFPAEAKHLPSCMGRGSE